MKQSESSEPTVTAQDILARIYSAYDRLRFAVDAQELVNTIAELKFLYGIPGNKKPVGCLKLENGAWKWHPTT